MTFKMMGKLLEMSRLFRSSNTPRAASLPSLIIPTHSLFFPPSYYSEQMCPLLARPPRHQGVRQGAGEERGRAAGAGLHPEEAGGDTSRQGKRGGEKKMVHSIRADPLTRGQIIWLSCVRTHTRAQSCSSH